MQELITFVKDILASDKSMESLIVYKNESGYKINKKSDIIFDTRSIAKTVLSLICGILIDQNPQSFNLETDIYPIIKDKIDIRDRKNLRRFEEVKVKHLLTHTTGYRDLVLFSKDIKERDEAELLDYVVNYPLYYKPGKHFLYSNAGFYLLAVTIEEYLGRDLLEYAQQNLFDPLDIKNRKWERYGDYLAGATKLYLKADDLLKFGKLIINQGIYQGRQIVSSSYIDQMASPQMDNLNETKREYISEDKYGLGIWISDSGVIFASGTGGQLIVILRDLDIVIVTTNIGSDSKSHRIKADVDGLIRLLYKEKNNGL